MKRDIIICIIITSSASIYANIQLPLPGDELYDAATSTFLRKPRAPRPS